MLFCESARWGNMDALQTARTGPMTKSDPACPADKPYGDWDRNCAYSVNVWPPERRAYYPLLTALFAVGSLRCGFGKSFDRRTGLAKGRRAR